MSQHDTCTALWLLTTCGWPLALVTGQLASTLLLLTANLVALSALALVDWRRSRLT